jgi:DNA-directed RNA polymerase subunit RPC12/RpoP
MEKRLKYQCWYCDKTYTLYKEIQVNTKFEVACPYCHKEGMVDLRKPKYRKITTHKGDAVEPGQMTELDLPDIIPTEEPEPDQT